MGHITEPSGIDFVVDPKPLTKLDKKRISDIIALYKSTGKKVSARKPVKKRIKAKVEKNKD